MGIHLASILVFTTRIRREASPMCWECRCITQSLLTLAQLLGVWSGALEGCRSPHRTNCPPCNPRLAPSVHLAFPDRHGFSGPLRTVLSFCPCLSITCRCPSLPTYVKLRPRDISSKLIHSFASNYGKLQRPVALLPDAAVYGRHNAVQQHCLST